MAYQGYLIKVGDFKIPLSWIRADSYSVLLSGQDLDSYRDTDGKLHRTALEHTLAKVEFETPNMKTNTQVSAFLKKIQDNYTDKIEKKVSATVYIPELDDYTTQDMYIPDITFTMYSANETEIKYNAFRIALIEY